MNARWIRNIAQVRKDMKTLNESFRRESAQMRRELALYRLECDHKTPDGADASRAALGPRRCSLCGEEQEES